MNEFLHGMNVMACLVVGLFFLRFWRKTRDRLFAIFAASFWLMGLNGIVMAALHDDEVSSMRYVVRLIAFLMILWAIVDKNGWLGLQRKS